MRSIYLIGSLRNPNIPDIGNALRAAGFEAFDDWFSAGKIADDSWLEYEKRRGRTMLEALEGHAAKNVFAFDHKHIERCDCAVLVTPAGKSGHLELGYALGRGKPGYVLFTEEPSRWDVMYQFASGVFVELPKLIDALNFEAEAVEDLLRGKVQFQFQPGLVASYPLRDTRDAAETDAVFDGYAKYSKTLGSGLIWLAPGRIREIVS